MDTAKPNSSAENITAVFSLRLAGLAKGVDRAALFEYLRERMEIPLEGVVERLKSRRDRILDFSSRDDARAEQLRLGDMGAVTVINEGWAVDDWLFDADVPERFEAQLAKAEANDAPLVVARLHASAPVVDPQANTLCATQSGRECLRVSAHDFLIFCPPGSAKGAASWARAIASRLSLALANTPRFETQVALCPEQGRSLVELHRAFRALGDDGQDASSTAPERTKFSEPPINWPLAGSAWPQILGIGLSKATADAPVAVADYIRAYWPADPDSLRHYQTPATGETNGRNILRNYALSSDSRQRSRGRLLQKIRGLRELPTLPVMAMQAYRLAQSPDSNADQLAKFVEKEPALSSRILAVVNSPHFGLSSKVESIRHGIVLMGWEEIAHLALLLSSKVVFGGGLGDKGQELWHHAAQSAEVARHLAQRVPDVSASRMFTAGLLHDVGKVCLYMVDAEAMTACAHHAKQVRLPSYEIERERLGLDHAEVSGMLLRHWGLPETLCHVIERHHGVWPGESSLPLESALLGLVDHIAHRVDDGELHGDQTRIHTAHAKPLEPYFGVFSNVTTDLLAEDLQGQLRHAA